MEIVVVWSVGEFLNVFYMRLLVRVFFALDFNDECWKNGKRSICSQFRDPSNLCMSARHSNHRIVGIDGGVSRSLPKPHRNHCCCFFLSLFCGPLSSLVHINRGFLKYFCSTEQQVLGNITRMTSGIITTKSGAFRSEGVGIGRERGRPQCTRAGKAITSYFIFRPPPTPPL